jgi:hypothetical protein
MKLSLTMEHSKQTLIRRNLQFLMGKTRPTKILMEKEQKIGGNPWPVKTRRV